MSKPAIPSVPGTADDRSRFDRAIKETLELHTGARGTRITQLSANAGLSDVIKKINEIIATLQ